METATISKRLVLAAVRDALRFVVEHADTGGRAGGYFGLFPKERFGKIAPAEVFKAIGNIKSGKRALAKKRAQEKPRRLSRHRDHISSYQSRNEKRDYWGGAIAAKKYYLSFSGLPESCDEALVLIAGRKLGMLSDRQARRIAGKSNNRLFFRWADTHRV